MAKNMCETIAFEKIRLVCQHELMLLKLLEATLYQIRKCVVIFMTTFNIVQRWNGQSRIAYSSNFDLMIVRFHSTFLVGNESCSFYDCQIWWSTEQFAHDDSSKWFIQMLFGQQKNLFSSWIQCGFDTTKSFLSPGFPSTSHWINVRFHRMLHTISALASTITQSSTIAKRKASGMKKLSK